MSDNSSSPRGEVEENNQKEVQQWRKEVEVNLVPPKLCKGCLGWSVVSNMETLNDYIFHYSIFELCARRWPVEALAGRLIKAEDWGKKNIHGGKEPELSLESPPKYQTHLNTSCCVKPPKRCWRVHHHYSLLVTKTFSLYLYSVTAQQQLP